MNFMRATCLASILLACSSQLTLAAELATIRMWGLTEEGSKQFFDFAKTEFAKIHPNVTIINEFYPNEAYKTNLKVALAGSQPPDIFFNWAGQDAQQYIKEGLALDLTSAAGIAGGFGSSLSKTWQASFESDGKIYGVPIEAVSKYFFYNKSFFLKNNLNPPKSFGELGQLCKAIRKIDPSLVPLPLGNSERWKVIHYMTMINDRVVGSARTSVDYSLNASDEELFSDQGYVEAWEKLLELKSSGCFQDAPNATSPEVSRTMFTVEASPMIYCGTWCMPIFDSEGFTDYGQFRMPPIEDGRGNPLANMLVPQGYMVSAKTKNPELSAEWLSFLVSGPIAAKFAEFRKAIPSNPSNVDSLTNVSDQFKWTVKDVSTFGEGVNSLDVNLDKEISEAYLNAGVEILNKQISPKQAMEKIRSVALTVKTKRNR